MPPTTYTFTFKVTIQGEGADEAEAYLNAVQALAANPGEAPDPYEKVEEVPQ